jgi:hypothetical protein
MNVALLKLSNLALKELRTRAHGADISTSAGVINPIRTTTTESSVCTEFAKAEIVQLFTQFEAVDSDTPLLRMDRGKTSLGRTQPKSRHRVIKRRKWEGEIRLTNGSVANPVGRCKCIQATMECVLVKEVICIIRTYTIAIQAAAELEAQSSSNWLT